MSTKNNYKKSVKPKIQERSVISLKIIIIMYIKSDR